MPSVNPSPYAQQDEEFNALAMRVRYHTQARSLKMLVLLRKRYPVPIWLCTPLTKDPSFSDTWGTGTNPMEALKDLAEELGIIPLTLEGIEERHDEK